MLFYLTTLLKQTVNLAFIGNVYSNKSMIEAIGMVNVYLNCTLMSLYGGIIAGIETLCANALASKKYKLLGYYFQRARIVSYTITTTLTIVHLSTIRLVLKAFKLNDEVTAYGSKYCYSCLIYVFFDVQTVTIMRLNNVLGKSYVNCYIFIVQLAFHPLWNWIFVTVMDLDVVGAGISYAISKFIGALFTTCFLWFFHPVKKANFWINRHCFRWKGIKEYLRFSLGAAFLEIAEWWGFEILAIIAIQFGDDNYAVYVLIAEFINLLYSVPVGFMITITILIGEIVTKYSIPEVKRAARILVSFGLFTMFCILIIFFIIRNKLFHAFTQDPKLNDIAHRVLWIVSINEMFDMSQNATLSIFKGLGKQYLAAGFMFVSIYILMMSYVVIFGFALKLKLRGLIIGQGCGYVTSTTIYATALFCFLDFRKAQIQTFKRLKKDSNILKAQAATKNEDEDEENDEEIAAINQEEEKPQEAPKEKPKEEPQEPVVPQQPVVPEENKNEYEKVDQAPNDQNEFKVENAEQQPSDANEGEQQPQEQPETAEQAPEGDQQ